MDLADISTKSEIAQQGKLNMTSMMLSHFNHKSIFLLNLVTTDSSKYLHSLLQTKVMAVGVGRMLWSR